MRAARQGAFDGLCGVYAVINALDLVSPPQRRGQLHADLFRQLSHALGAAALLEAMQDGLEARDLLRAAGLAFSWLGATHGIELEVSQPFLDTDFRKAENYVAALRSLYERGDTAAVIGVKTPRFAHWTVPRAFTDDAILLRDSQGLVELPLADYTLKVGSHRFRPVDTLVIQGLPCSG